MFKGLSLLRKDERKQQGPSEEQKKLQAYLQKYTSPASDAQPKKKKKKKLATAAQHTAVRIIDEDLSGFKAVKANAGSDDDDDELVPVVANPEEAKVYERQLQEAKNYYSAKEDGRGWVALPTDTPELDVRRQRHDSPDLDVPRKAPAAGDVDLSVQRKRRHDSPDLEVPRRPAAPTPSVAEDLEPPRKRRHDSPDADVPRRPLAPPHGYLSPPRRQRHDSPDMEAPAMSGRDAGDLEVPRRPPTGKGGSGVAPPGRPRHDSLDLEPPRKGRPADIPGADIDVPRKRRHDSPDLEPPRRSRPAPETDGDLEPPRKGQQAEGDLEVPRKRRHDSPDLEPPRRGAAVGVEAAAAGGAGGKPAIMKDGTATGLVTAEQMAREAERLHFEAAARKKAAQGKGAETVYRDRATGKIQTSEEFAESRDKKLQAQKKREAKDADQYLAWRGGLAQQRKAQEAQRSMEEEAAKPFARYEPEADLDMGKREALRWGDPMAHLVKKRAADELAPVTHGQSAEALEKSGFVIPQDIPAHSWIKRGKAPPENRYGIKPGRHWDGVDRSTGFEANMFKFKNTRAAQELEAYSWATADM